MTAQDPRIAALEALFVVADLGTGRYRLTVPEIASGGIGGAEDGPVGTIGYVSRVKAALVGAILRRLDEAAPAVPDPAPADAIAIYPHERDWIAAERAALARERDEARADRDNIQRTAQALRDQAERLLEELNAARAEVAALKADLATRSPARAAQLVLFAPPAADPAGEAQRAASSGAAVGAIVGAAADAPAPLDRVKAAAQAHGPLTAAEGFAELEGVDLSPGERAQLRKLPDAYKPKPRACGTCGQTGHNVREARRVMGCPNGSGCEYCKREPVRTIVGVMTRRVQRRCWKLQRVEPVGGPRENWRAWSRRVGLRRGSR